MLACVAGSNFCFAIPPRMLELTESNLAAILFQSGKITSPLAVRVRELSGGVSNVVLLIEEEEEAGQRYVVKQARGKLRVQADWHCSIERIWREVDVLNASHTLLGGESDLLPQILWVDRELYAYAMTAAPAESRTWKEQLLAGELSRDVATICGDLLGRLHAGSWHAQPIAEQFEDRTYFRELRLEPYYAHAAQQYPAFAKPLQQLIENTWNERHALVHGDFSPKNLLVTAAGARLQVMLIDFEVGHYGDPAFDLGFFLTHLTLKSIHLPEGRTGFLKLIDSFWQSYVQRMQIKLTSEELCSLEHRAAMNLAGCLVARVHGKSPVDYLTAANKTAAVDVAERLFTLGEQANWLSLRKTIQQ
ncbi:phosphotransferase family protein [Anatilimnocola sp. NA78]|uniref:phosphotransferase family protein n=1 Tax=Anatilimnocola sp. NA78 TaxID=3415683 RepID=UPI003CE4D94A